MITHPLKGKLAISYARWSSGRQAKGNSLKRQTESAEAYCHKTGMRLDLSIVDDGVSAFTGSNLKAGLGVLLGDLRSGKVPADRVLLVENMDRLSRLNPMDVMPIFLEVLNTGMTVVTLQDEMVHSAEKLRDQPMLLIPSLVAMQLAHDESKKKSDRLSASWRGRVEKLQAGERIPISKVPFWIDQKTQDFNSRVDDARTLFNFAEGGHGTTSIMRLLNERGIKSPRGGTWGKAVVQDVLCSKEAYGTLEIKGQEIPNYYPAIISETRWIALRNRAAQQTRNPQASSYVNVFPRLLRCGICGSTMSVSSTRGKNKRFRYAACEGRTAARRNCDGRNWPYNLVEDAFVSRLGVLLSSPISPGAASEPDELSDLNIRIDDLSRKHQTAVERSVEAQSEETSRVFLRLAEKHSEERKALVSKRQDLLSRIADQTVAGEAISDLEASEEEIARLQREDRPRLKALIAALVDMVTLHRYDPGDMSAATVLLKTGREYNLVLEGSRPRT